MGWRQAACGGGVLKAYTYWEGSRPPYIAECLRRMEAQGVTVLTPENTAEFAALLHPNFSLITHPAHRADCIRVAAISQTGGLWLDADCLLIRPIETFLSRVETSNADDFVYTQWNDGRVLNGYFWAKEGSEVAKAWLGLINKTLYQATNPTWTMFGEQILTPTVMLKYKNICSQFDRKFFIPINTDKIAHAFFEELEYSAFDKPYTIGVNLNHSFFCDHYPKYVGMSLEELKDSKTLLGSAFNHAY